MTARRWNLNNLSFALLTLQAKFTFVQKDNEVGGTELIYGVPCLAHSRFASARSHTAL